MNTLAERLRQTRKQAGLTQGELCKRVGITQPTYSDLETGKQISTSYLPQIADLLGVDALWLATGRTKTCEGLSPSIEAAVGSMNANELQELIALATNRLAFLAQAPNTKNVLW